MVLVNRPVDCLYGVDELHVGAIDNVAVDDVDAFLNVGVVEHLTEFARFRCHGFTQGTQILVLEIHRHIFNRGLEVSVVVRYNCYLF